MKIGAHIPTQQYGYVEITDAELSDLPEIERLYNQYAEKPVSFKGDRGLLVEGFVGGSIYYDPIAHVYTNESGEVYQSSTQYAETFTKPFDKQGISKAMSKKSGVKQEDLLAQWEMKGEISRTLGTALHLAIELERRYNVKHTSPLLEKPLEELRKLLPVGKEALEAVVIDHPNKQVGRIDLIRITGDKTCEVIDFKTGEMKDHYWKQLEFTARILERNDWKVSKLKIYHYSGVWGVHEHDFKF